MKQVQRIFALFLVLALCLSMFPATVFATQPEDIPQETAVPETSEPEEETVPESSTPTGTTEPAEPAEPAEVAAAVTGVYRNFTYIITGSSVTITGAAGEFFESMDVPDTIERLPVTEIADNAFSSRSSGYFFEVRLPETLTRIGENAFAGTGLQQVSIPVSVSTLGANCFRNCNSLTGITFLHDQDDDLTIGDGAFSSDITLNTIVSVPNTAKICPAIADYDWALSKRNVTWHSFAADPVYGNTGNLRYKIENNEVTILNCADSANGTVTVPSHIEGFPVTRLEDEAFYECWNVNKVKLPNTLRSIGNRAFQEMELESLHIPASVTEIGYAAFSSYIQKITVAEDNPAFSSKGRCLFSKDKTVFLSYHADPNDNASYTVPSTVKRIAPYAFYNSFVDKVTLPDTLTTIDAYAFSDTNDLAKINIPESVTFIGDHAFYGACELSKITLPAGLHAIEPFTFAHSSLRSIHIPESITSIGKSAFFSCGLEYISIPASITVLEDSVFGNCRSLRDILFAHGQDDPLTISNSAFFLSWLYDPVNTGIYLQDIDNINPAIRDYPWANQQRNVTYYEGSSIPVYGTSGLFNYKIADEEVTILSCAARASGKVTVPEKIKGKPVVHLEDKAFEECQRVITSLSLPKTLKDIGQRGIPNTIQKIIVDSANPYFSSKNGCLLSKDQTVFYSYHNPNTNLAKYTVPSTVQRIASYGFNVAQVGEVILPEGLTTIDPYAFKGSTFSAIHIPDSVTSIENMLLIRATILSLSLCRRI